VDVAGGAFKLLGDAGQNALGRIAESVGKALGDFATYSKAQEQLKKAHKETAEESVAAVAAQVQAVLGGLAQQAGVKAVFEAAEGIASAASYNYPAAVQHFAAAAIYGSIGVGAAVAGHAIGEVRGNTAQENEQLDAARGGSSGGGGGRRESGGGGPITIRIDNGGRIWTPNQISDAMKRGIKSAERTS
jgi:hypothetical protein